jgi:hypothetical protein
VPSVGVFAAALHQQLLPQSMSQHPCTTVLHNIQCLVLPHDRGTFLLQALACLIQLHASFGSYLRGVIFNATFYVQSSSPNTLTSNSEVSEFLDGTMSQFFTELVRGMHSVRRSQVVGQQTDSGLDPL